MENPLPKSVKVRSTCNACQQAKIRCSHEKPACRRCQKHNLTCVYSISRRLGRPAKKKDGEDGEGHATGLGAEAMDMDPKEHGQRVKSPKKQKKRVVVDEESTLDVLDEGALLLDEVGMGGIGMGLGIGIGIDIGDTGDPGGLQMDGFVDASPTALFSDGGIDLSSDSWLHEFMSNPAADLAQERELLDSLGLSSIKPESTNAGDSPEMKDIPKTFIGDDTYIAPASFEQDPIENTGIVDTHPEKYIKEESLAWPQPFSAMDDFTARSMVTESAFTQTKVSKRPYYGFPPSEMKPPAMLAPQHYQCQCHEKTIQDLIRVNVFASRASPCLTIDSLIYCQRVLQQLSEIILQCSVCYRARLNVLMVVIVSIDSLLSALEPITLMEANVVDRLFSGYHDQLLSDYKAEIAGNPTLRRYNFQSKSQVEACSLKVGTFCVAYDDKYFFIKSLLLYWLEKLGGTVQRIRVCAENIQPMQPSQGRLLLIMETGRRLESVIKQTRRM
ncbi:Zn(II)2Cys6 transcription factor domain-containing protein [Aspergillus ibericus CBS 121593]|uniref:AflR-like C6 transcription factor n=1 Tax=Aspergillus ibericus CBS 121593 TaxID=1448316 RepID=A0A395HEJ6_9EURO|nr:AflR-like C6 transcription factor [Aspergillus ibericus CBS 121593]RAL04654.1 AflR-like C6 transcription factor [Aspergillus ibericus CBS 121593]